MALSVRQYLQSREINKSGKHNISVIEIDGNTIKGYFEYFFVRKKTYVKEPERSNAGIIGNLNSYATFLTPMVRIKFNAMSIDMYRLLIKLIESKNEFTVGCYDFVNDKWITQKMYFYPNDYPEIYQYDLEVLAIMNYEIELVGTNSDFEEYTITYNYNIPYGVAWNYETSATQTFTSNLSDIVGGINAQYTVEDEDGNKVRYNLSSIDGSYSEEENPPFKNYIFQGWSDNADGTGFVYIDGDAYFMTTDKTLYARWRESA